MTLRVDAGAIEAVTGGHEAAASGIDALADSLPTSIDGGMATAHLLAIVAAVASTAGDLADINRAAVQQVQYAADDVELTEGDVAGAFAELAAVVR